jgi:hypothetical protein
LEENAFKQIQKYLEDPALRARFCNVRAGYKEDGVESSKDEQDKHGELPGTSRTALDPLAAQTVDQTSRNLPKPRNRKQNNYQKHRKSITNTYLEGRSQLAQLGPVGG